MSKYPFQIFGKMNCSNCETLKNIMDKNKKEYEYKLLDVDFTRKEVEWFFKDLDPEIKQFPIIRYNGMFISYFHFTKIYLDNFLSQ